MATAITMAASNGGGTGAAAETAAAAAAAATTGANGGSHDTPDAHRLHHKDNALEHWGKIESLLTEKQANDTYTHPFMDLVST